MTKQSYYVKKFTTFAPVPRINMLKRLIIGPERGYNLSVKTLKGDNLMVTADWIAIAVFVIAGALGVIFGFGKLLKFFTKGIIGFLISCFVVYFFIGVVASWPFVRAIMEKLHESMVGANNGFVDFLIKIGIEKIILAVIMFIVVQLLRILIVSLIKSGFEIDNKVIKVINKFLGFVFMLAVAFMICLTVFQIIAWVGGSSADYFRNSVLGVDPYKGGFMRWLYDHNPLNALFAKL